MAAERCDGDGRGGGAVLVVSLGLAGFTVFFAVAAMAAGVGVSLLTPSGWFLFSRIAEPLSTVPALPQSFSF